LEAALGHYLTLEEDVRKRTVEVERHLQQHPDDVASWIAYSTLHLKLSPELARRAGTDPTGQGTLPQTRANSEVALSILARALDAHPANMASSKLHIAYLHAAEAFWPAEKVTSRWKNVLRELSERAGQEEQGMMQLWLGYIDWREGQGFGKSADGRKGIGGVDEVVEVYAECIAKLPVNGQNGTSISKIEKIDSLTSL